MILFTPNGPSRTTTKGVHKKLINYAAQQKTRRSGLSAGALRMPDTSEVARDFSPAWSLTPQVRKL
ncbi:hypothetical protein FRV13_09330 [Escherichia coli]|nr:hypothetical protein [Escherichia coli]BDI36074.1 hypothetical protein EsCdI10290_01760 [Escherichia sp. 10290]BDI45998.1 hypothetical protein EsCd1HHP049_01721 [Escherichia sp. HH154_1D]EFO1702548.1 hypothetical protein [Escherichia coli]EGO6591416.1 hypothetical protein [Escherichia coli]